MKNKLFMALQLFADDPAPADPKPADPADPKPGKEDPDPKADPKPVPKYTDEDLERLSLIMTLHDIGFKPAEVEHYMNLVLEGKQKDAERLKMLDKIREKALDEIHFREKQLSRLDYLRYEIRNRQDKKQAEECLKSISK